MFGCIKCLKGWELMNEEKKANVYNDLPTWI